MLFLLQLHSNSQSLTWSSIFFVCQMKTHIFLILIPKFQLQIHNTWEVENVPISGIPNLTFFMYFYDSFILFYFFKIL